MLKQRSLSIALPIVLLAMPIWPQGSASNKAAVGAPTVAQLGNPSAKTATDDPNYVIGAQDLLDISVWKEPDLSRSVPVRPDGKISLPLLNDVQAAGLTPLELGAKITASLNKFVNNPQVTVIVNQINSQRIYILGEVARPGSYTLLPRMTVLQALSNAGGPGPFAKTKKIYLLRQENGKQDRLPFNYKEVIEGKQAERNVALMPGDVIVVP